MSKKYEKITFPLSAVARAIRISDQISNSMMGRSDCMHISTRCNNLQLLITWHRDEKSLILGISDVIGDSVRISAPGLSKQRKEGVRICDAKSRLEWFTA